MQQRAVTFVARTSKDKYTFLRDNRKVVRGETVLVDFPEALVLLRNPGAMTDEGAEWIPARRDEVV